VVIAAARVQHLIAGRRDLHLHAFELADEFGAQRQVGGNRQMPVLDGRDGS
jgi:hypothetical protein